VFPKVEGRYLQAVVVLAEELNFTRAAHLLRISQPALSKQIAEFEEQYQLRLFVREKGRIVDLTDAGRAFVEEARSALFHTERAIHLARAAHEGSESVLMVGHSHHANHEWISTILAIRLPLYPKLKVRLATRFPLELVRSVLAGELSLALVTAPPEDAEITAVPFARAPLYAAISENHPAANKERLVLRDLAEDEWILFARQVHPVVYDAILETARFEAIAPKDAHDTFTAQQAVYLVSEHAGIAIFADPPPSFARHVDGVVTKPLSDKSLCFDTCLIMRADQDSRAVNEFGRAFLRKYAPQRLPAKQMDLPLPA
jgi:DNA-binding transcriptional LysR family regulator